MSAPGKESDATGISDEALIEELAQKIVEKKLDAMAVFCIEAARPLSFIAGQAMIFLGPLVQAVFPMRDYKRYAALLEDRRSLELLVKKIRDSSHAGKDGSVPKDVDD